MKERPILFSAPMVRALLDGTKTQTRRVLKIQPPDCFKAAHDGHACTNHYGLDGYAMREGFYWDLGRSDASQQFWPAGVMGKSVFCPYGQPGDRLWVKETWRTAASLDAKSPSAIALSCLDAGYRKPWAPLAYEADGHRNSEWRSFELKGETEPGKTRVSIHMPRWASRIELEITSVRVERLQDISEADAIAEGLSPQHGGGWGLPDGSHFHSIDPRISYWSLWDAIHDEGSTESNPWVWCVEFRRITR